MSGNELGGSSNFAPQGNTAEDVLKTHTVGLVSHDDFRRRRAEAEQKRIQQEAADAESHKPLKKKSKTVAAGKLSFADDGEDEVAHVRPKSSTPDVARPSTDDDAPVFKKKLGPNASIANAPRARTKFALKHEEETREQLRKQFLEIQEAVRATEIAIPFVFFDGTNIPGGTVRVKKGEPIWLFLDKARKLGAKLEAGGEDFRKRWARTAVDDILFVRGEIIIPHHYDFYHFIINKAQGFTGPLFDFSDKPPAKTHDDNKEEEVPAEPISYLSRPGDVKKKKKEPEGPVEGEDDEPSITRVVDRRWYDKNKHIFPASVWAEYDQYKDYRKDVRKDAQGNPIFFA